MIVYTYDENGFYSGQHVCQTNPVGGGFLYPARYLLDQPENISGKVAKHENGKWVYVNNYVGSEIWNVDDGIKRICPTREVPNGFTTDPKPPDPWYIYRNGNWIIDEERRKAVTNSIIELQLRELDIKRIRAVAEISDDDTGASVKQEAKAKIKTLNAEADNLRKQMIK